MKTRRHRVLNARALAITLAVTILASLGVRKLHSYQFDKTRNFLRKTAIQAGDAGDFRTSCTLLQQYLALKPSDAAARDQLSRMLAEQIGTEDALEQAFRLNEDLLRDQVPQSDLRIRQARLAVRLKKYSDAEAHLQVLRTSLSESSEVWYLSATAARMMRHDENALQYLRQSIRCRNPLPEAFYALATSQSADADDDRSADELMGQMIQRNPIPAAWLLRARWLMSQQRFSDAVRDLWEVLEAEPTNRRANTMLSLCLQTQSLRNDRSAARLGASEGVTAANGENATDNVNRALQHFRQLTEQYPDDSGFCIALASLCWQTGARREAISTLEAIRQRSGDSAEAFRQLFEYLLADSQTDRARRIFEQIPHSSLKSFERDYLQGRLMMAEEKWSKAAVSLEHCIAFAAEDSVLIARAELSLAMARRMLGDATSALETYKHVLNTDPESISGRMGMAAAWLDSDRKDMAIAEYQRLLDVPGVAEWLTSLIIDQNLQKPQSLRDWKLAEQLVAEVPKRISDAAQRLLLQADLLFAQGRVISGLDLLDQATQEFPDRIELSRAYRRATGELAADVRERLQQIVAQHPDDIAPHAWLVRLHLAARDTNAAETWLNNVVRGVVCPTLSESQRLQVVVETLRLAAEREHLSGRDQFIDWLQQKTLSRLEELIRISPTELPKLAQELAVQNRTSEALSRIQSVAHELPPGVLASSLLASVRFAASTDPANPRYQVALAAGDGVRQLIARHPLDPELRSVYAEIMVIAEQYDVALETLRQIAVMDPGHGGSRAGMAWIMTVSGRDKVEASRLAAEAERLSTNDVDVACCIARVDIANGRFDRALDRLRSVRPETGEHQRTAVELLYEAHCLAALDESEKARLLLPQVRARAARDPLLPVDQRMLEALEQRF